MALQYGYGSPAAAPAPLAFQASRNTTSYPATAVGGTTPHSASTYPAPTPPTNPYAAQTAKNTTGYPATATPAAPTPAPTKNVAAPEQPATPPASSVPGWDPTADPVYQQIQAQATQSRADAESAALASKKQLAIQYGDADLANQLGDTTTAAAAAGNPDSVTALLNAQQPKDELALDEHLNDGNLLYSGARITQQGDLADKYQQQRYGDTQDEQAALAGIDSQRLAALLGASNTQDQALSDAYARYIQQLLANPPAAAPAPPPGAGGGGTPYSPGGPDSPNPGSGGTGDGSANIGYAATPVGRQMVQQILARPASAGSSGAAQTLLAAAKKKNVPNYQAARNAI